MKKQIAISLSPNTDWSDVRAAFRVLSTPTSWQNTAFTQEAQDRLVAEFPGHHVVLNSSGRQALYDALRAFGIGSGDEVILQAFTCIAVPESIVWTGATPVYADIAKESYSASLQNIQAKVTSATRAIIVQHTFGIPADIQEIVAFAHQHNIVVIEDCAHALGATVAGRPVGTFGDAAIISFGRDKMVSSIFGGGIVFKDKEMAERAREFAVSRSYPPTSWIIQQLLHPLLFAVIIPLYFSGIGKLLLVGAQKVKLLSKAVEFSERSGQMPAHVQWKYSPALAQLLLQQITDVSKNIARRRAIANRYRSAFANTNMLLARVPDATNPSWLRFPLQVKNPTAMHKKAREEQMLLGDWYDAPLVPGDASLSAFHYEPKSCPVAEDVATRIINLPTYPGLTDKQVEKVIQFCMEYYGHGN